jgi:hypothetical protein
MMKRILIAAALIAAAQTPAHAEHWWMHHVTSQGAIVCVDADTFINKSPAEAYEAIRSEEGVTPQIVDGGFGEVDVCKTVEWCLKYFHDGKRAMCESFAKHDNDAGAAESHKLDKYR